jgi:hypothetical protein
MKKKFNHDSKQETLTIIQLWDNIIKVSFFHIYTFNIINNQSHMN